VVNPRETQAGVFQQVGSDRDQIRRWISANGETKKNKKTQQNNKENETTKKNTNTVLPSWEEEEGRGRGVNQAVRAGKSTGRTIK